MVNYAHSDTSVAPSNSQHITSIDEELESGVGINDQSSSRSNYGIPVSQEKGEPHQEIHHHNIRSYFPRKFSNPIKHNRIPSPHEESETTETDQPHRTHFGLNFDRNNTFMDDTHINLNNIRYSIGERIRSVMYKVEDTIGPIVKKIIPNFIIAHYVYILFWVILGSVIIYPQKDMEYVDALMYAAGASTQGGLATTQMNDMKLYQQIAVYVVCMFTTPIFIHGSLTFLRLYWYEKRFDNIKEKSIQQYKMRRTATIANMRTETLHARTMTNVSGNARDRGYDSHNASEGLTSRMKRFENNLRTQNNGKSADIRPKSPSKHNSQDSTVHVNDNLASPTRLRFENVRFQDTNNQLSNSNEAVSHLSEPSDDSDSASSSDSSESENENAITDDDDDDDVSSLMQSSNNSANNTQTSRRTADVTRKNKGKNNANTSTDIDNSNINNTSNTPNIKFGELPRPTKKKKRELDPRDLYMSISVLQNNPKKNEDIESGPALHIKSPRELEEDKKARRLPGHRLKHRKLLKERRLKRLKERGREMVDNQKKILHKDIEDLKKDDFALHLPSSFDIDPPNNKNQRSLSVPAFIDDHPLSTDSSNLDSKDENDSTENNLNHISTNDQRINQKLKKMERSHTIHIPGISKKLFTTIENDIRKEFATGTDSNHEDNGSDTEDVPKKANKRRTSFFTRTLTGMSRRRTMSDPSALSDDELVDQYGAQFPTNYLSWNPTVGRNSKFITLSTDQKYELGGVEYQAMRLLSKLLLMYYVGFHIAGIVFFVPFIDTKKGYKQQLREVGVSPTWWAFFNSMSSFNDLGYSLNPTSMVMFAENAYVLVISAFFIVIGNTGFPIFLRLIIWVLRLFTRPLTMTHDSLSFLLDHPRRCFTLLFPSGPTWWLTAVLIILNGFDWILFIILDFGSSTLSYLPKGYQVLAGLFQSVSTRTAGFNVVNLATLHPAIQVSYMVMMYISVLPLAISIRRTNVYEEQSLGVYDREEEANPDSEPKLKYIGTHLRKQLSFDLWFLFLAIFIICIVEGGRLRKGDVNFGIFQIMFEVTSAYGTVGLSLGYPTSNASFCGEFTKLSKLVIIATLIRGRHRGLPNSIDRAIMLSDQTLNLRDDLEAYHAMRRNNTMVSDDMNSLFPSISRAATRASRSRNSTIDRQPTISENLRNGVIPFKKIAHTVGKTLGKIASNVLTVSGTSVDKYSRQLTQYNTYDPSYARSRSTTYSGYDRGSRRSTRIDEEDEDEDGYDGLHYPDYRDYNDRNYGRTNEAESIPLYHVGDAPPTEENNMHTHFIDRLNDRRMYDNRMQEGSSSSEDRTNPNINGYDGFVSGEDIRAYHTNDSGHDAENKQRYEEARLSKYRSR